MFGIDWIPGSLRRIHHSRLDLDFGGEKDALSFTVGCWNGLKLQEVQQNLDLRRMSRHHRDIACTTRKPGARTVPVPWPPATSCLPCWSPVWGWQESYCPSPRASAVSAQTLSPDCGETFYWCSPSLPPWGQHIWSFKHSNSFNIILNKAQKLRSDLLWDLRMAQTHLRSL